jgi:hypothetical protein
MPAGARLGKSVALKTPERTPTAPGETHFERPTGRMLIFWGCGEHAPKGQPVIIDFAKIAAGQMPPGLWSSAVPLDRYVTPANSRTYGQWPSDDGKSARPDSSLIGAHRIAGNYAPDINFTLTKDFMGALQGSSAAQPGGATLLRWNALPGATGYHASIIGGKQGARVGTSRWISCGGRPARRASSAAAWRTGWRLHRRAAGCQPHRAVATDDDLHRAGRGQAGRARLYVRFDLRLWSGGGLRLSAAPRRSQNRVEAGMDRAYSPPFDDRLPRRHGRPWRGERAQPQRECPTKPKKRGLGGLGGLIGGALGRPRAVRTAADRGCWRSSGIAGPARRGRWRTPRMAARRAAGRFV